MKKMRKKTLIFTGVILFGLVLSLNVLVTSSSDKENVLASLDLNFFEKAMSQSEGGDSNCPGGTCSYTDQNGNTCSSCCQSSYSASCTWSGCRCE